jgi:hypothetical protein
MSKQTDEQLTSEIKELSRDALIHWANGTTSMTDLNFTLTVLVELTCTIFERQVPVDQLAKARTMVVGALDESIKHAKETEERSQLDELEESAKVSQKKTDKSSMN